MEKFILDMLTTLGLGINGFIASYNCDKIEELLPAYTLFVHKREGEAIVDFTRKDTGEVVFTINFTTNEKGCITAMEFSVLKTTITNNNDLWTDRHLIS